jgi:hypothetical protein
MIIQSQEATLSDLIRDFKNLQINFEKIQNSPESRRDWMLERFKLNRKSFKKQKYQLAIWQSSKKSTTTSLCGQS